MIEVFRTNVEDPEDAGKLICEIHRAFADCQANFDLDDCDRILRVKCTTASIEASPIIDFVRSFGFNAEVLTDCVSDVN